MSLRQIYVKSSWMLSIIFLGILCSCSPTRRLASDQILLRKNIIVDSTGMVDKAEALDYLKQRPNKYIFRFFPFYLGIHNIYSAETVKKKSEIRKAKRKRRDEKRLAKGKSKKEKEHLSFAEWIHEIGEPPVVYDPQLIDRSARQLEKYLQGKGFFYSVVEDTAIVKKQKAKVVYSLDVKPPHLVKEVKYRASDVALLSNVLEDTAHSNIKTGSAFEIDKLSSERERLVRL